MKKKIGLAMVVVLSAMWSGVTLADTEPTVKVISNPQIPPPPIVQNAGEPTDPRICISC